MKKKYIFSIYTNELITLLTCYNSHMIQAHSKEEEDTALNKINKALESYRTKITKTQSA